jgi:hypothetical protein
MQAHSQRRSLLIAYRSMVLGVLLALVGCNPFDTKPGAGGGPVVGPVGPGPLRGARIDATVVRSADGPLRLAGAGNETIGSLVRIDAGPDPRFARVRLSPLTHEIDGVVLGASPVWSQLLFVPADLNRAGFVRQLGPTSVERGELPRALLPLALRDGAIDLSSLRDPSRPAERSAVPAGRAVDLWLDLAVPTRARPGTYRGAVELLDASTAVVASMPVELVVYNFVLPDDRDLRLVGELPWDELAQLYPEAFEAVTPRLVKRGEPRYERTVATVDALTKLAHAHRVGAYVDRLQPTVKWPPGQPPLIDWGDFDSLVGPYLDGTAFADGIGAGVWPLPGVDFLSNYPIASQRQYLNAAAAHFDSRDWLIRAPVWVADRAPTSGAQKRELLRRTNDVLSSHPRIRAAIPIEADDIDYAAGADTQDLPQPTFVDRIWSAAPSLVSNSPTRQVVPLGNRRNLTSFLRADVPGLVPYVGAGGDERDVRTWAFLAYVRNASIVRFGNTLPRATRQLERADPNELIWFYPGKWFGVDDIAIPTLQLKWLRRAQQDYQYLRLADQRGQRINAQLMARLLTKPVEIQPTQPADPVYALMAGTIDPSAWDDGMVLLAKTILLREPGQQPDEELQNQLNRETLRWLVPREQPLLVARTTLFNIAEKGAVDVRVGTDIYNASDATPYDSQLGFDRVPSGWTVEPNPVIVPPLATYRVQPYALRALVDATQFDASKPARVELGFTEGFRKTQTPVPAIVPVAPVHRREGGLVVDGVLSDWTDDDAIRLGSLVKMVDRPGIQGHTIELTPGTQNTALYASWAERDVYVAFRVGGLNDKPLPSVQNFVKYQFRRAWGEDVVQVLVQPIYTDGSAGPTLHVACKPNGGQWSERKTDPRASCGDDASWEAVESGVRYGATIDADTWRGELAIPWRALHPVGFVAAPDKRVALLRFNFTQHQHKTGTTSTWAGPVDHGRDDAFTGALVVKE